MDEKDFALEKSAEIYGLLSELRELRKKNQALASEYGEAQNRVRERRFIRARLSRLAKKTGKYHRKIAALFGECTQATMAKLDREIEKAEAVLRKKTTVLEFYRQVEEKESQ